MNVRTLAVASDAALLPALNRFLQDFWTDSRLPSNPRVQVELALEEVFLNIVHHGTPRGTVLRVELTLALADDGLVMTIADDGPPFDPSAAPAPDVTAALEARPVGGLGVHLVRQVMDAVDYDRIGTLNRLRLRKRL